MRYRLPAFPSTVGIWRFGTAPPAFPAITSPAQLTPGRRTNTPYIHHPAGAVVPANMQILLPRGTDIRDSKAPAGPDLVEVPIGSGRLYDVVFVDDVGFGFANEHRFAYLRGIPVWPLPYPSLPIARPSATWIGSGSSLGVPVVQIGINLAVPVAGLLFILVADYNSAAGACATFIFGGGTFFTPFVSPVAAALGQTVFTSLFVYPIAPGYHAGGVKVVFGLDVFQYQLVFVTGIYSGTADVGINGIGAGLPLLAGAPGQVNANDVFIGQFGQIGSAGPFGFALPFVSTGGDVTDVIGGVPCTLSVATLLTTIQGLYPCAMPLADDAAWSGLADGFS